jgi:hypothetical protein
MKLPVTFIKMTLSSHDAGAPWNFFCTKPTTKASRNVIIPCGLGFSSFSLKIYQLDHHQQSYDMSIHTLTAARLVCNDLFLPRFYSGM